MRRPIKKFAKQLICSHLLLALVVVGVAHAGAVQSDDDQSKIRVTTAIWLDGNSTVHAFTCTAAVVNDILVGPTVTGKGDLLQAVVSKQFSSYTAVIPVKDIHSHDTDMDKNMYKALKLEKYPEIRFVMTSYDLTQANLPSDQPIKIKGNLNIAGQEKPIVLTAILAQTAKGFRIRGSYELLMKDYGIEPPSIMFVINVDNKIVVHFDVTVS